MMKKSKKRSPKTILKLPDLDHSKTAVLNSLFSLSSRHSYDHAIRDFIDWYCSEPRLASNRTVVTRYRIALEQRRYAPSTINLRLAAVRRLAYGHPTAVFSAQTWPPASAATDDTTISRKLNK
ncbi:MAG: integrase/recombinase XerC [Acidobacteriaceae bacterium]|nr:integrase/recombinase XerC [Acidobacteriaceae bacterium]